MATLTTISIPVAVNAFISPSEPPATYLNIIDGTIEHYEDETNILYDENDIKEVRATFLKALARERYDLYKSNFDLEMRVTD